MNQQNPSVVAIDLGSNSFHLLEATLDAGGALRPVTALARKVQLALDMDDGLITDAAMQRGFDCLREFAPYCRGLPAQRIRVVGTQALRLARNRKTFVDTAEQLLGYPVEVISGEDEARLAFWGVSADPTVAQDLLVVDVGGASTELVTGRCAAIENATSLHLGCVSWLNYFPDGRISGAAYDRAREAAAAAVRPVAPRFCGPWQATGCSGTLLAVGEVLRQNDWTDGTINRQGLVQLEKALLCFERVEAVRFQGLLENRRNIFASGVAIVSALFEALELDTMALSSFALREGVAWQMLRQLPNDNVPTAG